MLSPAHTVLLVLMPLLEGGREVEAQSAGTACMARSLAGLSLAFTLLGRRRVEKVSKKPLLARKEGLYFNAAASGGSAHARSLFGVSLAISH